MRDWEIELDLDDQDLVDAIYFLGFMDSDRARSKPRRGRSKSRRRSRKKRRS